ncbi:hypothetical protein U9M48_006483 [Paspalum notatum var. saurae]|uniref:Uncharacterized protein n=1 Tax=Paspalum notatum var. saurae TaxID=547442 RepID=A0AAQ3PSB0_PASNO
MAPPPQAPECSRDAAQEQRRWVLVASVPYPVATTDDDDVQLVLSAPPRLLHLKLPLRLTPNDDRFCYTTGILAAADRSSGLLLVEVVVTPRAQGTSRRRELHICGTQRRSCCNPGELRRRRSLPAQVSHTHARDGGQSILCCEQLSSGFLYID